MNVQTPSTLQKLALQALLRDEALALSSLDEVPFLLFPALFKEAFAGRLKKLIKAMVATWTFPCLPVGSLMKSPNLETLQAVLDGIDMRLTRESHIRRVIIKSCIREHMGTQQRLWGQGEWFLMESSDSGAGTLKLLSSWTKDSCN